MEQLVEMHLPNILGAEKEAIEKAVSIAKKMGFRKDRIEDLKTAVAEACINAIEHGNKFDKNTKVEVTLSCDSNSLKVVVHDKGDGFDLQKISQDKADKDGFPQRRGHGIFLINNLVNEFSVENEPGKGNNVKMMIHLDK